MSFEGPAGKSAPRPTMRRVAPDGSLAIDGFLNRRDWFIADRFPESALAGHGLTDMILVPAGGVGFLFCGGCGDFPVEILGRRVGGTGLPTDR